LELIVNNQFEPLEHGEVISIKNADRVLVGHHTFRVEELATTIKSQLQNAISDWSAGKDDWFTANGIECEALRFGSNGWQKGRIRLCLEFCPDDGEQTSGNSAKSAPIDRAANISETLASPLDMPAPTPPTSSRVPAQTPRLDTNAAAVIGTVGAVGLGAMGVGAADALTANEPAPVDMTEEITLEDNPTPVDVTAEDITLEDNPTLDLPAAVEELESASPATPEAAIETATPAVVEPTNLPPIEEVILVTDREPTVAVNNNAVNLDEISFDFNNDSFSLASLGLDGKMDLELSDLAIDGIDSNDFIDFETSNPNNLEGIANAIDVDDIDRPENSGMLIDEVWSELHPSNNWPSVNRG
jgi:hypothetical protein